MTAQIPEQLHIDHEVHSLCTNPLSQYFDKADISNPFDGHRCTALWRGYVGTWEIVRDRLYMIRLEGYQTGSDMPATLETLFPGFPERVFAHWFTGELRVPQGKLLKYVHGGYSSTYERDLFIAIEHGCVLSRRVHVNGLADPEAPEGYLVAAATTHGRSSS